MTTSHGFIPKAPTDLNAALPVNDQCTLLVKVLETSRAFVLVLDTQGNVIRFNHACERAVGYLAAEESRQ